MRRVRFKTPEERELERLELLSEIVEAYPHVLWIHRGASRRWGDTVRRAGASAVALTVSEHQRLLFMSHKLSSGATPASDLHLCSLVANTYKDRNKRLTYIGEKLIRDSGAKDQVNGDGAWRKLTTGVSPSQIRGRAREKGLVVFATHDGGVMTEAGLTIGASLALVQEAKA